MQPRTVLLALAMLAAGAAAAAADSLWRPSPGPHFHWFADTKARRVGDIVTILISEKSEAKTDLSQSHSKETAANAVIEEFRNLCGINKPADGATDATKGLPVIDWKSSRTYDAKATAESKDELELRISAVVKEVLPNGHLIIDASRQIRHDHDVRIIHLTGIVRPADIAAGNTVRSESIAEARISYEGFGPAARAKHKGIGNRLIDLIWPF
jgi:flagellar L-ring protein precursor FlgH